MRKKLIRSYDKLIDEANIAEKAGDEKAASKARRDAKFVMELIKELV